MCAPGQLCCFEKSFLSSLLQCLHPPSWALWRPLACNVSLGTLDKPHSHWSWGPCDSQPLVCSLPLGHTTTTHHPYFCPEIWKLHSLDQWPCFWNGRYTIWLWRSHVSVLTSALESEATSLQVHFWGKFKSMFPDSFKSQCAPWH